MLDAYLIHVDHGMFEGEKDKEHVWFYFFV